MRKFIHYQNEAGEKLIGGRHVQYGKRVIPAAGSSFKEN